MRRQKSKSEPKRLESILEIAPPHTEHSALLRGVHFLAIARRFQAKGMMVYAQISGLGLLHAMCVTVLFPLRWSIQGSLRPSLLKLLYLNY